MNRKIFGFTVSSTPQFASGMVSAEFLSVSVSLPNQCAGGPEWGK